MDSESGRDREKLYMYRISCEREPQNVSSQIEINDIGFIYFVSIWCHNQIENQNQN